MLKFLLLFLIYFFCYNELEKEKNLPSVEFHILHLHSSIYTISLKVKKKSAQYFLKIKKKIF